MTRDGGKLRKPIKSAIALVIVNDDGDFLTTKRAEDDRSLPGIWGFPAVTLEADELPEHAVHRAARQKLGIEIDQISLIACGRIERSDYILELTDYAGRIRSGTPVVPQPDRSVSQYVEWRFEGNPELLAPSARYGSLCSQLFLDSIGFNWRDVGTWQPHD